MKQRKLKVIIWVMALVAVQLCVLPTAKAVEPCPLPSDINAILDLLWLCLIQTGTEVYQHQNCLLFIPSHRNIFQWLIQTMMES
jgi:hypothetical protein